MELQFIGLAEMLEKLEKARVGMAGAEMRKALRAGGNVIKEAMKDRAPVLDSYTLNSSALPPGSLRAGIRVYVPPNEDPAQVLIGPSAKTEHVAHFVEYGHVLVHHGRSGEDVPAHPWLRPAFEESVVEAGEAIEASLLKSFKEILS